MTAPAPAGGEAPAVKKLDADQIDEVVASRLGPKADRNCKEYVQEVCKMQRGPGALKACQGYADSMKDIANDKKQGPAACKSVRDSVVNHH